VFVDNGSTDGSLGRVRARFPELVVIQNGANLGFGRAANHGASEALARGAGSVFFVNNDLLVERGVTARLAGVLAENSGVGIVGPRVLQRADPERIWCAGGTLTWRTNLSRLRGHGRRDGSEWRREEAVDYVPGCALLTRRALLERLGGFEADYFAYMEDVELCLRARQAGYEVRYVGDVATVHASSSATGGGYNARRKYMNAVNSVWFLRRHGSAARWASFLVFDVLSWPLALLAAACRGRARAALAKGLGLWDGLRGRRVEGARLRQGATRLW
jgi:GT2 family glycosyltransferase